jgi:hypothetical protein
MYKCIACGNYVLEKDASEEYNDVFEWWFVTDWFAEKLAEHGETVIQGWHNVWGRTCTGQAIAMDWVVAKIAEEMGILEGMENDWSKWMDK